MKVLLIRPHNQGNINTRLPESLNKRQGVLPPLGLGYIASALQKAGHKVALLDAIALNLTRKEIREEIAAFQPELVGVTTMTSNLFGALDAITLGKEAGAATVLGGPQLSIYPKETLAHACVDYGIHGEGEAVVVELVRALEAGQGVGHIQGLIYRDHGVVRVNDPVIVEDLDSVAFPAYDLMPMSKYDSIIGKYPVSTMISTRGCPYQCHFCAKQPSDRKFRCRSAQNVVDEMETLAQRYGVREIMFYDDVMTLRRSHIVGICEEILARNLKVAWETPTRINNVDQNLLLLMRRAGCVRLRYGVESGDETILKLMNKGIDLKRAKEVFRMTAQAGIRTFAYFIIGYAHETEETIRKTIGFAQTLNPDLVMFTVATPYPQTPLYDLAQREGLIHHDYWRDFTLGKSTETRFPYFVSNADQWVKKAYASFYFRPNFVFKKVAQIRSFDDVRKSWQAFMGIFRMS